MPTLPHHDGRRHVSKMYVQFLASLKEQFPFIDSPIDIELMDRTAIRLAQESDRRKRSKNRKSQERRIVAFDAKEDTDTTRTLDIIQYFRYRNIEASGKKKRSEPSK